MDKEFQRVRGTFDLFGEEYYQYKELKTKGQKEQIDRTLEFSSVSIYG